MDDCEMTKDEEDFEKMSKEEEDFKETSNIEDIIHTLEAKSSPAYKKQKKVKFLTDTNNRAEYEPGV